jgi:uncharacterized RDD family membrane protein YckC
MNCSRFIDQADLWCKVLLKESEVAYDFHLDTPEVVRVDYTPAGIGSRSLAAMIDYLAIGGIGILLAIVCLLIAAAGAAVLATLLGLTGAFIDLWGYFVIYETVWSGQTPGKRAVHIRVMKSTGYPIGFVEAVIRNLVRIIDFLPSFYGVGIITMFISPQARRLGDYAAGTVVVKEQVQVRLADLSVPPDTSLRATAPPSRGQVDPDEFSWNVRILEERQVAIMQQYLDRAPGLPQEASARIGGEIARRIATTVGAREPLDPGPFMERVLFLRDQGGNQATVTPPGNETSER